MTNFIIAVRGYQNIKKEKKANYTDVTALDNLNNRVLLRIIDPLCNEYIGINDVKNMTEAIKREEYDSAFLISQKFTEKAIVEMAEQKIQQVSEDHLPAFNIEDLYLAITNCVSKQCTKQCGNSEIDKSVCNEKINLCKIRTLANAAKGHFEEGLTGLLKNDLKTALALNK